MAFMFMFMSSVVFHFKVKLVRQKVFDSSFCASYFILSEFNKSDFLLWTVVKIDVFSRRTLCYRWRCNKLIVSVINFFFKGKKGIIIIILIV